MPWRNVVDPPIKSFSKCKSDQAAEHINIENEASLRQDHQQSWARMDVGENLDSENLDRENLDRENLNRPESYIFTLSHSNCL